MILISRVFFFRLNFHLNYSAVPTRIFESLKRSNLVKYMKACKEVNIAFIPYEQQVNIFFFSFLLIFFLFILVWFCVYFCV